MDFLVMLLTVGVVFLGLTAPAWAGSGPGKSPEEVLNILKTGNERFGQDHMDAPLCGAARRNETATGGQHPLATILTCSDSRVPVELVFNQGLGDLFVIRVAGNVAAVDETATVEYGADHLGTPLVVVMGHTKCGAVTAVVQGAELHGHLPALLAPVKPVVAKVKAENPGASESDLLNKSIEANTWQGVAALLENSAIVRGLVSAGKIKVIGAIYDLESGRVTWLGEHPRQAELLKASGGAH